MAKRRSTTIPKALGACADKLFALREEKLALNREVKEIDQLISSIKEKLINELPKSKAEGVTGKVANAVIRTKDVGTVRDWDRLYKHIVKTKDFSLLQRRLSSPAVKEQWEAGRVIPGVEAFTTVDVSITKKG